MKRKLLLSLLCLVFLGITGYSGTQLCRQWNEQRAGKEAYEALNQYVQLEAAPAPREEKPAPVALRDAAPEETAPTEIPDDTLWPQVDFAALQEINPEVAAWIYIEGTNINYPVFQGTDNRYYLKHLIDGTYHSAGSLFIDYRNAPDFSDRHTVIYGHNMRNGTTMFAQLMHYKEQAFYDEHPTCLIVTPQGKFKIRFFAGYITDLNSQAWKLSFGSDGEYALWLEEAIEKSVFTGSITPTPQDRIVTLSACTYEFTDARFVLLGVVTEALS